MGCVAHVKKTIEAMEGVAHVIVDLPLNRAFIQANVPPNAADIQKLLGKKYGVAILVQDPIAVAASEGDYHSVNDHLNIADSPWKQLKTTLFNLWILDWRCFSSLFFRASSSGI
jgi:copper chaperone CopZ